MTKLIQKLALVTFFVALPVGAQTWDRSGNNLLSGTYGFRDAIYVYGYDTNGNLGPSRYISATGTITFSGNSAGTYTETVTYADTGSTTGTGTFTDVGTYAISASGYGYIAHPYATSGFVYGSVSNGVFVGSSTDALFNDIMVAVPLGSPSNATLSGNYSMAYMNWGSTAAATYDSMATFTANGAGSAGNATVKTYLAPVAGSTAIPATVNQTENGVSYSFASGQGTLKFPTATNLAVQGSKAFYISPDGSFFFGGALTGFDFFVGVRIPSTASTLNGLYYSAGVSQSPVDFSTNFGSLFARSGTIWEHQRYLSTLNTGPINYTQIAVYPTSPTTNYSDGISAVDYVIGQNGTYRIGVGQSPYLGIRVAVQAPTFSAPNSAPWINPTGVNNAGSLAPFTNGLAHGEVVSIFGSGLSSSTLISPDGSAYPLSLGGVQVMMNNRPAPLAFVSPNQINAVVPYGITDAIIQVQVINNNVTSNAVTEYLYTTSPGVYSLSSDGEGLGAILHANYQVVTEANPAVPGEAVLVYLTGLGDVFPTIADGAPGPSPNFSTTLNQITAYIDGVDVGSFGYNGLAPTLVGKYQINLSVPAGVSNGNVSLDILGPDSESIQVAIPIASGVSSDAVATVRAARKTVHRR